MAKKPTRTATPEQPAAETTKHFDAVQTLPNSDGVSSGSLRIEEVRPLSDFAVAPVAPEGEDATSVDPHTGSAAWAVSMFASFHAVRRASWIGAKALDPNHPEGRIVLHRDDLLARDWVFA